MSDGDTPHARLVDILHVGRDHVAFRYTEYPQRGDVMDSAKARLLDGTIPANGDPMFCGTCHEPINTGDVRPVGAVW